MEHAGNIAQAALDLNGVFEAAQKAADLYVESVKAMVNENLRKNRVDFNQDCKLQERRNVSDQNKNAVCATVISKDQQTFTVEEVMQILNLFNTLEESEHKEGTSDQEMTSCENSILNHQEDKS